MTDSPSPNSLPIPYVRAEPVVPDFTPVPRKNALTHGWTVAKQRSFIQALAATGSVRQATEAVGMSHCGVYKLRVAPGGESFAAAWDAAVRLGADQIRDVLIDQAINGVPEPIVYGGKIVGERRRFNHRTMQWTLQHHKPNEYPGGSTLHRRGGAAQESEAAKDAEGDRALAKMTAHLDALALSIKEKERDWLREVRADRDKRLAYELLYGVYDWGELDEPIVIPARVEDWRFTDARVPD